MTPKNKVWKDKFQSEFEKCMPEFFNGTCSLFLNSDPPDADEVTIQGSSGDIVVQPLTLKQSAYSPEQAAMHYRTFISEHFPAIFIKT